MSEHTYTNPSSLRLKINKSEAQSIFQYLHQCAQSAFNGNNNYMKVDKTREILLIYHTKELLKKLVDVVYKHSFDVHAKPFIISFTHAERITLQTLFKRVEVPTHLTNFEYLILNHLN